MSDTDGEVDDIDWDSEYVKVTQQLDGAGSALKRVDPTTPGLVRWLENHLLPILGRMNKVSGANRGFTEEVAELAQQALVMSERTLAGETLSFLVPGLFAYEKYVAAVHPDPEHPVRRGLSYLLQACTGVREIFADQSDEVAAAMEEFITRAAGDGEAAPAEAAAVPAGDPATSETPPG